MARRGERMTLLAAVIGLVIGFLLAGTANLDRPGGAILCLIGATFGCIVISDVVAGAGRRQGSRSGPLAFLVSLIALVVVAIAILLSPAVLLLIAALLWACRSRRRRARPQARGPAGPALADARCRASLRSDAAKKLVLTYIDSLRTDMLELAIAEAGRRPLPPDRARESDPRIAFPASLGYPRCLR